MAIIILIWDTFPTLSSNRIVIFVVHLPGSNHHLQQKPLNFRATTNNQEMRVVGPKQVMDLGLIPVPDTMVSCKDKIMEAAQRRGILPPLSPLDNGKW